mgnify:CR=1 FL=1
MLLSLPSEYITKTPIKFGYLNPNRSFFGDFMETLPDDCVCGEGDRLQAELREVWDFNQNFNSINFLTNVRPKFSIGMVDPLLSVFTEEAPLMTEESPTPCFNFWTTFPKNSQDGDDSCLFEGNIIPLKNNFSEKETVTCSDCYRNYSYFNFGEHQLDSYKPSLLFTTNTLTETFEEGEFTFKLPDLSDPINLVDLDFSCFGSLAGSCPEEADHVIANGVVSWLKGDECESVWVDRYYGLVGETCLEDAPELESVLFEDIEPSQTVLSEGEEYIYRRPLTNKNLNVLTETCSPDSNTAELHGRFGFLSDAGYVNDKQVDAATILYRMGELDGVFFGGDNNYELGEASTIEANWDIFDPYVQAEKAFPAIGNHDLGVDDLAVAQTDKFDYLPHNRRYYNVFFEDASLELFVLNSGVNLSDEMVEPDGNAVGSIQYEWFIDALEASTAKYRVVMFHHPYVTGKSAGSNKVVTEMEWGFDELPVDLILNGHTHTNQHLKHNNLDILDLSAPVRDARLMSCSGSLYGETEGVELIWSDAEPCNIGEPSIASIEVTSCSMNVCVFNTSTGEGVYNFNIRNTRNSEVVEEECVEENVFGIIFEAECLVGDTLTDGSGNSNDAKFVI